MDRWFYLSYGAMLFGLLNIALICESLRNRHLDQFADFEAAMLYLRIGGRVAELILVVVLLFPVLIASQVVIEFISRMVTLHG